ncbi:MAG: carbamoyltransferase HypF [Acidiferrobacterales bacterium]
MHDDSRPAPAGSSPQQIVARRWMLGGRVQAVGFRPFVYRTAHRHGLSGWVRNRGGQVEILAQGTLAAIDEFAAALLAEAPPLAQPALLSVEDTLPGPLQAFTILESDDRSSAPIHVPPDYFACNDCLSEMQDPGNRRYRYPFINCTQCGPRYTLIRSLPYDRANTTMAGFALCDACWHEYQDPRDRRFHAEPIACPACGPAVEFRVPGAPVVSGTQAALAAGVAALQSGQIVAVKGVGGYHLVCDALNATVVKRLRLRKPRPHKPFAVMFPLRGRDGLDAVREAVTLDDESARWLRSPMRPIVLCRKKTASPLGIEIAPGLNEIGVMLPYSPLHHLLLADLDAPVVATSANVSGEPVLTERALLEERLEQVVDAGLHHNRPIERPADDAVYRVIAQRPRPLRLGRGGAPLERRLPLRLERPLLAVGGHAKNTVAIAWEDRVVISPHIGDLGSPHSLAVFERTVADLQALYRVEASAVVCDAHPGYGSTRWAKRCGLPLAEIYHHHAHASALAGEFPEAGAWLTFTWDGAGYGEDGTLWGGEALLGRPGAWRRVVRLRPFHLPGGEYAARQPWRSAAALCWETGNAWDSCPEDTTLLFAAWQRHLNSPMTTAAGRLFDAAASFTGLLHHASFEGQGPMYLEAACAASAEMVVLPLRRAAQGLWECDWGPLVPYLSDATLPVAQRAAGFHASLAHSLAQQARALRLEHRIDAVGLTGGVFQNRVLTEHACALLQNDGFKVYLARDIPCNDAGVSFGQIVERQAQLAGHSR